MLQGKHQGLRRCNKYGLSSPHRAPHLRLLQPFHRDAAVHRVLNGRGIQRRPFSTHAQEDGRTAALLPEGVVHVVRLLPAVLIARIEVILTAIQVFSHVPPAIAHGIAPQPACGGKPAAEALPCLSSFSTRKSRPSARTNLIQQPLKRRWVSRQSRNELERGKHRHGQAKGAGSTGSQHLRSWTW